MYVSYKSIQNFIVVNSLLLVLSFIQNHATFITFSLENKVVQFCCLLFLLVIRNYSLIQLIDHGVSNKETINKQTELIPKEEYPHEFHYYVLTTTSIDALTHMYIHNHVVFLVERTLLNDLLLFVPISFLFEIIFDFFHYSLHRLLHSSYLYKYCHKTHHKFKHPISITSFYQDPFDLVLTNSLPTVLSLSLTTPFLSYRQFQFALVYKIFIEISGHCGKKTYPTSSFPQFMWLAKLFRVDLYTEDHDLHHSLNNCNYAKRFSLWDKVFNTYKTYKTFSTLDN